MVWFEFSDSVLLTLPAVKNSPTICDSNIAVVVINFQRRNWEEMRFFQRFTHLETSSSGINI